MHNGVLAIGRTLGVVLALGFVASPASAQYYRDGYEGPRRYDDGYGRRSRDDDDGYGRRRYGEDFDRRRRYDDDDGPRFRGPPRGRGGSICVTARGSCPTAFAPPNAPCACDIPGFGVKRGAVAR